jgi:hypothetical protein
MLQQNAVCYFHPSAFVIRPFTTSIPPHALSAGECYSKMLYAISILQHSAFDSEGPGRHNIADRADDSEPRAEHSRASAHSDLSHHTKRNTSQIPDMAKQCLREIRRREQCGAYAREDARPTELSSA